MPALATLPAAPADRRADIARRRGRCEKHIRAATEEMLRIHSRITAARLAHAPIDHAEWMHFQSLKNHVMAMAFIGQFEHHGDA